MNKESYEKMYKECKNYWQAIIVGLTIFDEVLSTLNDISTHLDNMEQILQASRR